MPLYSFDASHAIITITMSRKPRKNPKHSKARSSQFSFIDYLAVAIGIVASILTIVIEQGQPLIYILMSVLMLNCGIMEMVLEIKGRRSNYIFALFSAIGSICVAFIDQFYGNMAINAFYIFVCIVGFYLWGKHSDKDKNVIARKLAPWQIAVVALLLIVAAAGLNILLEYFGGHSTVLDSVATILIIFASILGVLRYREQWFFWFTADMLILIMWLGTGNPAAIVMRIFLVFGSIYGYFNWRKLLKTHKHIHRSK